MRISDLLDLRSIDLKAAPKTKQETLEMACELMNKSGKLNDLKAYEKQVFAREEEGTTGVGDGIAIPHGRCAAVNAPGLAAMVIPEGVDFDSMDGAPVTLLFLIAAPDTKDNVHLEVLSKLSVLMMQEEFADKLRAAKTNVTLAQPGCDIAYEHIKFPASKFRTAIKAKEQKDEEKMGEALAKMSAEDPTIIVEYSKELKQTILKGQGEQHINIVRWRLQNENKIEIEMFPPKISYRETITKVAVANYRHKKQSGGAGQFGEVHLLICPIVEGVEATNKFKVDGKEMVLNIKSKESFDLEWGGKLEFYNCIVGGAIDARFMPAILKGIMEKMSEGPLTGSLARDIRVYVFDGKMHPVDSNEISFVLAARNAFKEAFRNAGPKIMEPIYSLEVMTPSEYMGSCMSDLQNRRALIEGMGSDKGFDVIKARVPLAELYKYSTTLSSLTSGSATFTMEFADYQPVPSDVQDKLLKAYAEQDTEE